MDSNKKIKKFIHELIEITDYLKYGRKQAESTIVQYHWVSVSEKGWPKG